MAPIIEESFSADLC